MKHLSAFLLLLCFTHNTHAQVNEASINNIHCRYQVAEGRLHGSYLSYYANGQLRSMGNFNHNEREGRWVIWDSLGQVKTDQNFDALLSQQRCTPTEKYLPKKQDSQLVSQRPIHYITLHDHGVMWEKTQWRTIPNETLADLRFEKQTADSMKPFVSPGVLDGIYVKDYMRTTHCIFCYPASEKAGPVWQKRVWRLLENSRTNYPFFHASSFSQLLFTAIAQKQVTAFSDKDDAFGAPVSFEQIDTVQYRITGFKLKEDWHFHQARSVMDLRIVGLAVVGTHKITGDALTLCWFYFPDLVTLLKNTKAYGLRNGFSSMYDLLWKRMFLSSVYKESETAETLDLVAPAADKNTSAEFFQLNLIENEHSLWIQRQ